MHDTATDTPTDTAVELVPLKIDFDTVFRGYDRDQVQRYVHATERDTRLLIADRDAALSQAEDLARQLGSARATIRQLQATVDRFSRTPPDPAALPERLRRMVELATAEADEITRRANAAAERTWRHAEETAARLTERHRELLAELDDRRRTMETEHAELIRRAEADIDHMTREAHQHRAELDRRAEQLRAQAQADFNLAMSARRAELEADFAQRRAQADAEFEQHAGALRDEITRLRRLRDAIRDQLGTAERLLTDVLADIDDTDDTDDIGTEERQPELPLSLPTQRAENLDAPKRPSHQVKGSAATAAELAGSTR